ncbi:MAG: SocA family protein, partial [Clostridia bacterium]|nr:SocA family protein [Clostridia bacterium]
TAIEVFHQNQDMYLRKSIHARYAKFNGTVSHCGGVKLNIDKVVDTIRYLSNSADVINLFKVKLMKLLWYIDILSYKRRGVSVTGLAYKALPLGAVPIAHDLIMDLHGIHYEEVDFEESTGYHFLADNKNVYTALSAEDIAIIDDIIRYFGKESKENIVQHMHGERAYIETASYDIIQYGYAADLSIS